MRTNGYGSVITHIEPSHLEEIQVPNAPIELRKRIHEMIVHSYTLRDESNEMINKATQLLIEELHLPPIHEMGKSNPIVNTYSVKLSDINLRLDASYHVPIVDVITAHLRQYADEVTNIGDSRISKEIILPGRFKRVYVEEGQGRTFFGGKQLYELDPSNKKYLSITKHSARINAELEIAEHTILITRSGTVGKVAIAPKHWEHRIASDHIIRVFPINADIAGYLYIFLASDYGYQLMTHFTYGSVVDEIDANHVSQIPFPILKDTAAQAEINRLALEANVLRYKAYQQEQKALQIMNDDVLYAQ